MRILIVKSFRACTGFRMVHFQRMKVFDVPKELAEEIIAEGYAVPFDFMSKLPLTLEPEVQTT